MKAIHVIGQILLWVGGLNWGLVGLAALINNTSGMEWNVVHMVLGSWPQVEAVVYVLVGLAALWAIVKHRTECRVCSGM